MAWLGRVLGYLVLAALLAGGRAEAHASLVESSPADGAVVAAAPVAMRLRFDEPVSPIILRLVDASGTAHPDLPHGAQNETVTIALPRNLPRGTQVLSYRVISSDGHPVGGSIVFSVGAPSAASARTEAQTDPAVAVAIWLARLALYLGLFAGAGGAFFIVWISRDATTPGSCAVVRCAMVLGAAAAVLSVGLQGLDALDLRLPDLASPHPWHEGIATAFGLTAAAAVLALLCAGTALRSGLKSMALVGLAGAGLALALSGHAGTAAPQWLTRPSVFVHGMAAAFWTGALVPLALVVRDRGRASLPAVKRFSALAMPAVGLMVLAGLVLSVVQLRTPSALLSTGYGRIFLAKMAAVIGLLGLAALNRQRLTPHLALKDAGARDLVRSIVGEIGLAVAILGLVATWRFTPPPRAMIEPAAAPVHMHVHGGAAMVDLTVSPGRSGPVTIALSLLNGDFGPLDPKEVTVTFADPAAGIEPIERSATRAPDGTWRADAILPVSGQWQVRVDALVTDFEQATLNGTVVIRP